MSISTCIIDPWAQGRKHWFTRTHCNSKQVSPHSPVEKVDPALLLCAAMPDRYKFRRKLVPVPLQRLTTLWSPVCQHTQRPTGPNTPENGDTSAQAEICRIFYDRGSTRSHGCMQCRNLPPTMDVAVLRGRARPCLRVLRDVLSSLPGCDQEPSPQAAGRNIRVSR